MSDLVAYARDLEGQDSALADAIAAVDALRVEVSELRVRAQHAVDFVARLPEARRALADSLAEAEDELARRRGEAADAEARLERAQKEEEVLAARRAAVRARDAVASAERKQARLRGDADVLEAEAQTIDAALPELERHAEELAARVGATSRAADPARPEPGAAGVGAWAARAEAALFVARSGLETERERVIRQASELAAAALGEPAASSVSRVREELEQRLG